MLRECSIIQCRQCRKTYRNYLASSVPYLFKCATARSRCLGILVYCLNAMPHLYAVRCSSHGACSCGGRRRGANQRCSPCTVTQRRGAKARDSNASSAEARNGRTESRLVKCSSVMNLTLRPLRSVVTQHCIISTGKGYCCVADATVQPHFCFIS